MLNLSLIAQRKWVVGFIIVALIGAGSYLFLQNAKQKLLMQFEELVQKQTENGLLISYGSKTLKGMPWKMHLSLQDVRLHAQSVMGWKTHNPGEITISYSPLQGDRLTFRTDSPFQVTFDLPQLPAILIGKAQGDVSILEPLKRYTLELTNVAFKRESEQWLQAERLAFESSAVKAEPGSDKLLEGLEIEVDGITGQDIPFAKIDTIRATLAFTGSFQAGPLPQMLHTWMQSGGAVELSDLTIKADKLDIVSTGTLSLDEKLQPLATFTAEVSGVPETIDDLTQRGAINPTLARVYKMAYALALMASQSQNFKIAFEGKPSNDKALKLSLTLQDGSVSVGPTEIINFPKIDWEKLKIIP